MNTRQILLPAARILVARATKKLSFFFQSVIDFLNPQPVYHKESENIIISPLLIASEQYITIMHNRQN
jgi:hypothetical protein